jgi:hypothetical protein
MEVWQKDFSDHRIRDAGDYLQHVSYIRENPVRKNLCETASKFPYSSAFGGFELDPVPQGLKPTSLAETHAARLEGVPLQDKDVSVAAEAAPFKNKPSGWVGAVPLQNKSGKIAS